MKRTHACSTFKSMHRLTVRSFQKNDVCNLEKVFSRPPAAGSLMQQAGNIYSYCFSFFLLQS